MTTGKFIFSHTWFHLSSAGTSLKRIVPIFVFASIISGCSDSDDQTSKTASKHADPPASQAASKTTSGSNPQASAAPKRWYTQENLSRGGKVFAEHCAACHGTGGEGAFTWRQQDATGKFPPPPLNGTGHAWHHPFRVLGGQIKFGAPGGQGNMPPFADRLSDQEIVDVIAWFQDRWHDEIYAQWWQIEQRSKQ